MGNLVERENGLHY